MRPLLGREKTTASFSLLENRQATQPLVFQCYESPFAMNPNNASHTASGRPSPRDKELSGSILRSC